MQKSKTAVRGQKSFAAPVAPKFSSAPVLESLEDRKLMTATYDIGMMVNNGSNSAVPRTVAMLNNVGVKTVRLWYTVNDWNSRSINGSLALAQKYSDAGFDVDMEIDPGSGRDPGYTAAYNWFSWAASNSSLRNWIDHWEIGNEPDHAEYWNSTNLTSYVNDLLKPAYTALHAAGEEVISAGPSWNPQDVQTMINNGLLNYCDYVGFHPYATGVDGVKSSVAAVQKVVAGRKPMAATEWNVRGISDKNAWAAAVAAVYPTIKSAFALNYYFTAEVMNSTAGPAGVMNSDGSYNWPFYNAVSTFKYVGGSAGSGSVVSTPTPTPSPTPTPTPTSTGNTPAGAGSIYGSLFDDSNKNGTKDGSEKNSSGYFTVFLDTNGNGKLDAGEATTKTDASGNYSFTGLGKATYNVGAVLPNGYYVNTPTGTVSTAVASGGKNLNINVAVASGGKAVTSSPTPTVTPTPTTPTSTTPTSTPTTAAPSVTGLQLLDASTGKVIATYAKDMYLSLASLPTRNIAFAAATGGTVTSVVMEGVGKRNESTSGPYTLLGKNSSGGLNAMSVGKGSYTFGITAWNNGKSSSTFYVSVTFY